MAGHSRSKNGVASLAYVPAIHVLLATKKDVDARHKAGHDAGRCGSHPRPRLARIGSTWNSSQLATSLVRSFLSSTFLLMP